MLKSEVGGGPVMKGPRGIVLLLNLSSGYMEVHSYSHPTFCMFESFSQ